MLEGRGQQQLARVRAQIAQQKALLEDEFRRKDQIITAVMNQRLVQEKAGLRQKQELLKPSQEKPQPSDQSPQHENTDTTHSALTADLSKRLEGILEERLAKIEALVADLKYNDQASIPQENASTQEVNPEEDNDNIVDYRLAVAEAMIAGCRYEKPSITDKQAFLTSSCIGVLDASAVDMPKLTQLSVDQLDDRMRVRRDFANLLLQSASTKDDPAAVLVVVESFRRGNKDGEDYASFLAKVDARNDKDTLCLSRIALQDLSSGQLAVVILQAIAQARAHTSDLTAPQFISHLYALLVRCYQGLFTHLQHQQRDAAMTATPDASRRSMIGGEATNTPSSGKVGSGQWQSRLLEMEGFLRRMDDHKAASPSHVAMLKAQGSQLSMLSKPHDGNKASTSQWNQQQVQILQEKLDTTEKLYLQVLRQHEQQAQRVEYWQDLLAEQREAEYEDDTFDEEDEGTAKSNKEDVERQQERTARAQQVQKEVDRATLALAATRTERDELFTQCQELRDRLHDLVGSCNH
ncbi:Hypothetical protein PHPALM_6046 [Phytophthora palmivora]|uniref:Uncharacterized protein n=1 Tax=Phytophthora palmivora TaxID=4796 RepID=A0A2P4YFV8_9STRA|nr:Hypothetical protein PHPALM_6046 [Phytophthora palmivora]